MRLLLIYFLLMCQGIMAQIDPYQVLHARLLLPVPLFDSVEIGIDTGQMFQAHTYQSFSWLADGNYDSSTVWKNGQATSCFLGDMGTTYTAVRDSFFNGSISQSETRIYKDAQFRVDSVVKTSMSNNWDEYATAYDYDATGRLITFRTYWEEFGMLFRMYTHTLHYSGNRLDSITGRTAANLPVEVLNVYHYSNNQLDSVSGYFQRMPGQPLSLIRKTVLKWTPDKQVKEIAYAYPLNSGAWEFFEVWRFYRNNSAIGINEEKTEVHLYPNPAGEYLKVYLKKAKEAELQFIDAQGKLILQKPYSLHTELRSWPEGQYFLIVKSGSMKTVIPFLIER